MSNDDEKNKFRDSASGAAEKGGEEQSCSRYSFHTAAAKPRASPPPPISSSLTPHLNEDDGLNFVRSNIGLPAEYFLYDDDDDDGDIMMHLSDVSDLPRSLIVANIPGTVFINEDSKNEFEALFKQFDSSANFEYFRTFKRCRVSFSTPEAATMARINCHETDFKDGFIRCFFAQTFDQKTPDDDECDSNHLKLPALEKQFLISPPASPPVGWEQCREEGPVVNFELLSRLASLAHADVNEGIHELHSGGEDCPKIIIHTCEDSLDDEGNKMMASKLPQTRRPDYVSAGGGM